MTTGSNTLIEIIQAEIDSAGGLLPFDRFMALALYHPTHGYYLREAIDLGRQGDFTTAAEISPLYAHCFANQCAALLPAFSQPRVLELGAGTGRFAGDFLSRLAKACTLPHGYYIYEISPRLRQRQQALLASEYPDIFPLITWLDELPTSFSGIIIANEVLDALPVACFQVTEGGIQERFVGSTQQTLGWQLAEPKTLQLKEEAEALVKRYQLPIGYASEINLQSMSFVESLTKHLTKGVIFFADYGYGEREYYHPERDQGSLTCFHQHHHHNNPFAIPGEQDITAHVDFTRVIESAAAVGGSLAGFTTQSAFLLACGLLDMAAELEAGYDVTQQFALHQAIKTLTLPTEMGERIKIMAISKQMDNELIGFSLADRSREL